jgi:two-component system nitrate/nitrite sensor histidine kinase NarX
LGYTREELLQMKITDIDAPEYAAGFAERLQDQLEDGYLDNISGVHIAKDGRHIDIDVRSTMIDYRGQRVVLAVTRDITYLKRVEEAERNRRQLAEALLDSVVALNTTLKLDEVLNRVLTNLQNLVPHQAANIMLIEEEVAHLVAWHGYEDLGVSDEAIRHLNFVVAETPNLRHMIDTRDGIIIANTAQDSLWIETPISQRFSSVVGIPIELDGKVIGFLHLESIHQDFFATIDLRHLQTFGNLAAIAIKNARAFEQAQELAVVEERQRLARDLHDAVSQTLFSASMISETLPRLWDQNPAQVKPLLEELHQMTRGALAEMRTLLVELRPTALIEAQFSELVKQLTSALVGRAPVKLHLEVLEERSLPPDVQVALYRIMQEAVHNIAKHARASEVWVEASLKPAVVTLRIVDNGRGFDAAKVSPERFGVGIMGERARAIGAQLEITSTIKQGTEVKVTWLDPQGDAQK